MAVEKEVDRLAAKLTSLHEHGQRSLEEFINAIQDIKRELSEGNSLTYWCLGLYCDSNNRSSFFFFLCVDILLFAMTDSCLSDRNHQFHYSVVSGGLNAKDKKAVFWADSYYLRSFTQHG